MRAIHHRHRVPVNPLYQFGHDRVGCYPCVMGNKDDIRLVADNAPERIAEIRALETATQAERARRNGETPGRYAFTEATFFRTMVRDRQTMPIDEAVAWARTDRGGRQLPMFPPVPDGGCFRWGLCEAPEKPRTE